MRAQVKRSEWVAKSRECGALWEKDDDGVLFFGFFQADVENTKEEETKQKQKDNKTPKKNKTKQNKQTEISLVLYLSTHT
jgi:hypothetical protein